MRKRIILIMFVLLSSSLLMAESVKVHVKEVTVQYLKGSGNNLSCFGDKGVNYMFYFGEDPTMISIAKMMQAQLLTAKVSNLIVKIEYTQTGAGKLISTIRIDPKY